MFATTRQATRMLIVRQKGAEDVYHRTTIFFEGQLVALRPLKCLGIALKVAWPRHRACCEARA